MIYLDNAATTKTAKEVVEEMLPYFTENYGNPSTVYGLGAKSKKAVSSARRLIAESIHAQTEEIYFTSGGSEADNWALQAVCEQLKQKGKHIITSCIEHHAILHTCKFLERKGFAVTYLDVDQEGMVDPSKVEEAIRPDTILISVMYANNEIGTIQPIKEIGKIARKRGILFHTDAVQAFGHLSIDVEEDCIDLMSTSAHKLNGPKGIGFLYIRKGTLQQALLYGGNQERGKRAGTENVPAIVGFGKAVLMAVEQRQEREETERKLRDYLWNRLEKEIPHCLFNGSKENRLANNINVSFPGLEGESLIILLDLQGICASSGSACTTGAATPSHVLTAIGRSRVEANGSLRITLSAENTLEEMDQVVVALKDITERLSECSPIYADYIRNHTYTGTGTSENGRE